MPFGKEDTLEKEDFLDTYNNIIKKAVKESGCLLQCIRADDINRPGKIFDDVVHHTINSKLVIADLTDNNPNVMYELGIRHRSNNGTILMACKGTKLPFDTNQERTIFYDKTTENGKSEAYRKLINFIKGILNEIDLIDSPVLRLIKSKNITYNEEAKRIQNISKRNKLLVNSENREEVFSKGIILIKPGEFEPLVQALSFHYGCKGQPLYDMDNYLIFVNDNSNSDNIHATFLYKLYGSIYSFNEQIIYSNFASVVYNISRSLNSFTIFNFIIPINEICVDKPKMINTMNKLFGKNYYDNNNGIINETTGTTASLKIDIWDFQRIDEVQKELNLTV